MSAHVGTTVTAHVGTTVTAHVGVATLALAVTTDIGSSRSPTAATAVRAGPSTSSPTASARSVERPAAQPRAEWSDRLAAQQRAARSVGTPGRISGHIRLTMCACGPWRPLQRRAALAWRLNGTAQMRESSDDGLSAM